MSAVVHGPEGEPWAGCARHPGVPAEFRCCECGAYLCEACVEQGSHLLICRLCGERAVELDELERPSPGFGRPAGRPERPTFVPGTPPPAALGPLAEAPFTHHVVVPAATIAMVAALLFFLFDVRSVYWGGTAPLKWVGFWFVTATVLIARYGRASSDADRQGCYTLALAAATLAVMIAAPWGSSTDGLAGPVVNVVIVLAVWRFATRLTADLSLEGAGGEKPEEGLYGVERLRLERWRKEQGDSTRRKPAAETRGEGAVSTRRDPAAAVARLAAGVLVVFALGEPVLLSGPPAAGERALAAMIVFLLATGSLLAAASGVATLRRVRRLGGKTSGAAVAGRTATAAGLLTMVLAVALALPGVEYRGGGTARQVAPGDSGDVAGKGEAAETSRREDGGESRRAENRRGAEPRPAEAPRRVDDARPRGVGGPAAALLGLLAELGQWLRIPFFLAAAALALYGLWRALPRAGAFFTRLFESLSDALRRLAAGFRGVFRRRGAEPSATGRGDPFADLDALGALEPRDAVLAAYGRLLLAFERLGHERPERQTPYEFVASIPAPLKTLADPARSLTDVYVRAAYSGAAVDDADRAGAVAALRELGARAR